MNTVNISSIKKSAKKIAICNAFIIVFIITTFQDCSAWHCAVAFLFPSSVLNKYCEWIGQPIRLMY